MTTLDISDGAKEVLKEIFKNDAEKISVIERTIKFVDVILEKNKINEYVDEIKKIIAIEKKEDSVFIESIEILGCIKNILEDLYSHFESIKQSVLSKSDREFIKSNIDVIAQVVLIVAFDQIEDHQLVNQEILIKILSFVRVATVIDINMSVSKFQQFAKLFKCGN